MRVRAIDALVREQRIDIRALVAGDDPGAHVLGPRVSKRPELEEMASSGAYEEHVDAIVMVRHRLETPVASW
jgi:hypothetical protein